jgi:D-alanyl-D-alanine carboxypeptidase
MIPVSIVVPLLLMASCQSPTKIDASIYNCPSFENTMTDSSRIAKFEQLLKRLEDHGTVGAALVVESPQGNWAGAVGMADIPNGVPLKPGNMYKIGSITKTFNALTTLRLCMQGKLSLDDPISKYISKDMADNIANGRTATVRQIMDHSSRIPDIYDMNWVLGDYNYSHIRTSAVDLLKSIWGKPALNKNTYSNSNALLLGMVNAQIEGTSAFEAIKRHVIQPLGLQNTYVVSEEPEGKIPSYSNVYGNGKIIDVSDIDYGILGGTDNTQGGLISNLFDILTVFKAIHNPEFINVAMYQEMLKPVFNDNEYHDSTGLGIFIAETKFGKVIGHQGDIYGFHGMVYHFLEKDLYVALFENTYCDATMDLVKKRNELFEYLF